MFKPVHFKDSLFFCGKSYTVKYDNITNDKVNQYGTLSVTYGYCNNDGFWIQHKETERLNIKQLERKWNTLRSIAQYNK